MGAIDEFYDYDFGKLEYRSLMFVEEKKSLKIFSRKCSCKLH